MVAYLPNHVQVSLRHGFRSLACRHLSLRQKLGCALLLLWREVFVYFAFQVRYTSGICATIHPCMLAMQCVSCQLSVSSVAMWPAATGRSPRMFAVKASPVACPVSGASLRNCAAQTIHALVCYAVRTRGTIWDWHFGGIFIVRSLIMLQHNPCASWPCGSVCSVRQHCCMPGLNANGFSHTAAHSAVFTQTTCL